MPTTIILTCIIALGVGGAALAVPSLVEQVADGIWVVRDDNGQWGRNLSMDITHQNRAEYQARKVLDLSDLPPEVWERVTDVRVAAHFMVRDYSWFHGERNGLDEAFEVVVNGHVYEYPTDCGAPVMEEGKPPGMDWYEFAMPREQFTRGVNEIIMRKAPGDKNDDYLYLAIDRSVQPGNSYVSFDGGEWTQEKLTIPGGNGEYMIRLHLLTEEATARAVWRPGAEPDLDDPAGLLAYRGARGVRPDARGLPLSPGVPARLEWDPARSDRLKPLSVTIDASGPLTLRWLDAEGRPGEAAQVAADETVTLPADRTLRPGGVALETAQGEAILRAVIVEAGLTHYPSEPEIDMRPAIAAPAGAPVERAPTSRIEGETIRLENADLRARFSTADGRLRLESLFNEHTQSEMVREPEASGLFLVEVGERRFAGSRDFSVAGVEAQEGGFVARLSLAEPPLAVTLSVTIEQEGLRMGLELQNAGQEAVDFKLAFPHMAGLAVSEAAADDYYFFPLGGGIIADRPALIRAGYGDHAALYQVMGLFSPALGGGLSVRADDAEGWFKTLALRKHIPGESHVTDDRTTVTPTTDEFKWSNPLEPVEGVSFAYEYLRRTRGAGETFRPAAAVLSAHPGDWRVPMGAYADWARRVWEFRPYPSRLDEVVNMIAAGWGKGYLFRDGKYRTDIIRHDTDCIELMSWWDWSPLGPWSTPMDRLHEIMTEAEIKRWEPYFVEDPVTGEKMWNNQPGDYKGYNERFGGLPAFREAIQTYRDMGALVTLYTDPFRMDDASEIGQAHGKEWGVMKADGEYSRAYHVWNPCHDLPAVREWVAETMGRVMRETGAEGIRLDEYGHRGWACFNPDHEHTFAEWGTTEWQKATAEATRMVREAMDEAAPGSVLTAEHPGHDYLMQFMEGTITYDLTVLASPLRPLECNLQRFYFPECKPYELDHRGADRRHMKRFWNGVASFGAYYPAPMYRIMHENRDAYASFDCEPLIPTLARLVYANRFSANGKTLYHLYNATGYTFDGPALAVPLGADEHLFDLLNCRPAEVEQAGEERHVRVYLPRDETACIARFTRRLSLAREGDTLRVTVTDLPEGAQVAICDAQGEALLTVDAEAATVALDLSALPEGKAAGCVKLLSEGLLVDVAVLPEG